MQCWICIDAIYPPDDAVQLTCGHTWCKHCLKEEVVHSLQNRNWWPPRCCKPIGIDVSAVRSSLDEDLVQRMDETMEVFQSDNPVFCHFPKCGKFIPVNTDSDQGQFVHCTKCQRLTCVECKAAKDKHINPHECPDLISKEDKKLAEKEGWRQCPNKRCQKMLEKGDGCETMICVCGTKFCFDCGIVMNNQGGKCACGKFH